MDAESTPMASNFNGNGGLEKITPPIFKVISGLFNSEIHALTIADPAVNDLMTKKGIVVRC